MHVLYFYQQVVVKLLSFDFCPGCSMQVACLLLLQFHAKLLWGVVVCSHQRLDCHIVLVDQRLV